MHQSVSIIGPIVGEINYKISNAGVPWAEFTVLVTDTTHSKPVETEFIVLCFGKVAKTAQAEWNTGTIVSVSGRVSLGESKSGLKYIKLLADAASKLNIPHVSLANSVPMAASQMTNVTMEHPKSTSPWDINNAPGEVTPPIPSGQSPFKNSTPPAAKTFPKPNTFPKPVSPQKKIEQVEPLNPAILDEGDMPF